MCTNFKTETVKDGAVAVGRSLEFPILMPTALALLPVGLQGSGRIPEGTGLIGLPGDMTPPGRFIRSAIMVQRADQPVDAADAELHAAHFLKSLDIAPGVVKEPWGRAEIVDEGTVLDAVPNVARRRYAYRTVLIPQWDAVDLAATGFAKAARVQELTWSGSFTQVQI